MYIQINVILYIVNTSTYYNASVSSSVYQALVLHTEVTNVLKLQNNKIGRLKYSRDRAYRKHQHMDYTHKHVQIVFAATKQTKFTFYNY